MCCVPHSVVSIRNGFSLYLCVLLFLLLLLPYKLYDNIQWHYTFLSMMLAFVVHIYIFLLPIMYSWCCRYMFILDAFDCPQHTQLTISQIENMLQYSQIFTYLYTKHITHWHRHTRSTHYMHTCIHIYLNSLCYG